MAAYEGLVFRLGILKDMNKKLPTAIHDQEEKEYAEWVRKVTSADKQVQADVAQFVSGRGLSSTRSSKAGELMGELVVSSIRYQQFNAFIRDMSLVYLISQFEVFLQQVVSITLQKIPGPIMEKSITLKQLTKCRDINEARRQVIEKEIHDIRLTDPDETDDYFSRKLGIQLFTLSHWGDFKERFHRRHVIIHRLGTPDQKYLAKTGRKRIRELEVSRDYLASSIRLFSEMALKIARQLEERFGSDWPPDGPCKRITVYIEPSRHGRRTLAPSFS